MEIQLLCNAGLALFAEDAVLLVDIPNGSIEPFYTIDDLTWREIMERHGSYRNICGLYFSHDHPDHCDMGKVDAFRKRWPEIPIFLPSSYTEGGNVRMGSFTIEYTPVAHAAVEAEIPPHVVSWIEVAGKSIYIAADAALHVDAHMDFLKGRKANLAFWNAMYLSRPDTRQLLHTAADRSCIYHMPNENPDKFGLWRKCQRNYQRWGDELKDVTVMDAYPYTVAI